MGGSGTFRVGIDLDRLTRMGAVFRVSRGRARDPAVDRWLANVRPEFRSLATTCFDHLRRCGDDVLELLHDGCPVACVEDAPFGYVNVFKAHINVGFFQGADLPDPAGLLVGTGKRMRHVKVVAGEDPAAAPLRTLIEAAYADIKARLVAGPAEASTDAGVQRAR